jgi:bis(5'-nucleosyl)-tetraphosphatase (symmetrical)
MRWIIGDVHGCARELDDLLERVRFDERRDELWSVGDLVNRGPDSLAALRLWRDVAGRAVIGNHEVHALLVHGRRRLPKPGDTLERLFRDRDASRWMAQLRALPILVRLEGAGDDDGVWLVHAGLDPRWDDLHELMQRGVEADHDDAWLESEEVACATRIRCCTADGERSKHSEGPATCPPPFAPWDQFYRGRERVVHGHWAARGSYRGGRTIGLDSGCVWGGPLTAWCHEEDRFEQVPSRASGLGIKRVDLGG